MSPKANGSIVLVRICYLPIQNGPFPGASAPVRSTAPRDAK